MVVSSAMEKYRVRDRNYQNIFGEDLTLDEATRLKEQVVTSRRSHTARVEPMSVRVPGRDPLQIEGSPQDDYEVDVAVQTAVATSVVSGPQFSLDDGGQEVTVPYAGVIVVIPPGHELVVNGQVRPVMTSVEAGDRVMARPVDPVIIAARANALAAAQAQREAAQHHKAPLAARYRDKTVKPLVPRPGPLPKDKSVATGLHVRLTAAPPAPPKPQPSPLKVATIPDGKPMAADTPITDDDIHDVVSDVGGGASDSDLEHARRERDGG